MSRKVWRLLRALWCVLKNGGHERMLHSEPGRLTLRCYLCGHQSKGWHIDRPTVARFDYEVTQRTDDGRLVAERRFRIELP